MFLKKALATFCRSDKFKTLYKCVETFEFIRSTKGCQIIFLKCDWLENKSLNSHQKQAANPSSHANVQCFAVNRVLLGVSEPTPDGLALIFEFVKSKKDSLFVSKSYFGPESRIKPY